MNLFDFILLIVIFLSLLTAFSRGFISSVLGLLGWIAALVLTYLAFPYIKPFLLKKTSGSEFLTFCIGYIGSLIFFLIFFATLNFIISRSLGNLRGGYIDKFLGIIFGILRGYIIISFLFLCYMMTYSNLNGKDINDNAILPNFVKDSYSLPFLRYGSNYMLSFFNDQGIDGDQKVDNAFVINAISKLSTYANSDLLSKLYEEMNKANENEKTKVCLEVLYALFINYKNKAKSGEIGDDSTLPDSELKKVDFLLSRKIEKNLN